MISAILEGYPKSKKEFLVNGTHDVALWPVLTVSLPCKKTKATLVFSFQEEVGVETDEDHAVVVPSI